MTKRRSFSAHQAGADAGPRHATGQQLVETCDGHVQVPIQPKASLGGALGAGGRRQRRRPQPRVASTTNTDLRLMMKSPKVERPLACVLLPAKQSCRCCLLPYEGSTMLLRNAGPVGMTSHVACEGAHRSSAANLARRKLG